MSTEAPKATRLSRRKWIRSAVPVVVALGILVGLVLVYPKIRKLLSNKHDPPAQAVAPTVTLVEGTTDALRVEEAVAKRMGIRTAEAKVAAIAEALTLNGSLTLDAARLEQVRSRFDGEVAEIAKSDEGRELRFGDRVKSGQLLAVVWSRELGEKKASYWMLSHNNTSIQKHSIGWRNCTRTGRSPSDNTAIKNGRPKTIASRSLAR